MKTIRLLLLVGIVALLLAPAAFADHHPEKRLKHKLDKMHDRADELRENREERKAKHAALKDEHKAKRAEMKEALKACKGQDTEECNEKRAEARTHAKESLTKLPERAVERFNKLKDRIENSELSDEAKQEAIANIDEQISNLQAENAEVEALNEESTREEYSAAKESVKEKLEASKEAYKEVVQQLKNQRMGKFLDKAAGMKDRIEQKAADKGLDISSVDFGSFDAKIAEAKQLNEDGEFLESKKALREAYQILKDEVLPELRELKKEQGDDE